MNNHEVRVVIEKFFKFFRKCARKMEPELQFDDLILLWCEIKRFRAFLRMAGYESDTDLFLPAGIKEVYGKAGIIRNLQLHIHRIYNAAKNERKKPYKYMLLLESELDNWKDRLRKELSFNPWFDAEKIIKKELPNVIHLKAIENFVQEKITELDALIHNNHNSDDDLHLIRKKLKDLLHNFSTFEKELQRPFPVYVWNEEEIKIIKSVVAELEQFNDLCVSVSFLHQGIASEISDEEKKQLRVLLHHLSHEKEKAKINILAQLVIMNLHSIAVKTDHIN
ncbi:CHAD domain-containing protein [Solitalea lacus]|uniref:CHAD domain-containing protein n=1 Tax=Solitalea lacus TaxID=2911172 RepID=UPI001ED9F628|nr:CHAD domain-containing protein [Solitalea lacus]UKJ06728.1 CHAD domain-containing protein [Solitalea lacus]